jgi:hypothetical protein
MIHVLRSIGRVFPFLWYPPWNRPNEHCSSPAFRNLPTCRQTYLFHIHVKTGLRNFVVSTNVIILFLTGFTQSNLYIKLKFLPHTGQIVSPLWRPLGACCIRKIHKFQWLMRVHFWFVMRNTTTKCIYRYFYSTVYLHIRMWICWSYFSRWKSHPNKTNALYGKTQHGGRYRNFEGLDSQCIGLVWSYLLDFNWWRTSITGGRTWADSLCHSAVRYDCRLTIDPLLGYHLKFHLAEIIFSVFWFECVPIRSRFCLRRLILLDFVFDICIRHVLFEIILAYLSARPSMRMQFCGVT